MLLREHKLLSYCSTDKFFKIILFSKEQQQEIFILWEIIQILCNFCHIEKRKYKGSLP